MARVFISHSSRDNEPAARIKAWLSEQGFETPFLDYDKHAGIPPGADWEKTLYREIERSEAIVIIQTPNWLDSKWCFAEFTQARALGKAIFPIIETPAGDTLISPDIQALDLRKDREGGLEQLSRQLTQIALDAQGGFAWDASRPPYPGLLSFQEEDAALYFGRDDGIRRLIERLNARRAQGGTKLIALLGASGSGKSSLLRAGVIPRLKRAGRNWVVLPPMRPQARPVDELARSLAVACGGDADWRKLREELNGDNLALMLSDIANDLRMKAAANEAQILVPIDQAEELFGAADPDQAQHLFEILNAALSNDQPFIAVMALRSDFLGLLQSAERLTARFEEFSLAPMPLARIAQIIEGPARVAGLGIDEALVHQAVRDAETEDALPLLAFALRELYDRASNDNYLSLAEYNALGDAKEELTPLENAVRKAADDVLAEAMPGEEELTALREAFVPAMVRVNEEGEYVRCPARWDELPSKSYPLLELLAKARLLIVSQDGDARMVEVAHEALLRKWPRLRAWLDDAREFLAGKQQLERDLHDWERAPEADKTGALLTGLKLNRARGWLLERPHQLTAEERVFVQAGIDQAEAAERRKVRLRRILTWTSIAAALVLAIVAGLALWQRNDAIEAKKKSEAAKSEAQQNLVSAYLERIRSADEDGRWNENLFWLWRAYVEASDNFLGDPRRESALRLIGARAHQIQPPLRHQGKINFASLSPDGTLVLTLDIGNTARIWDAKSAKLIGSFDNGPYVSPAYLSSDGKHVIGITSAFSCGTSIWDVAQKKKIAETRLKGCKQVLEAAFSTDGAHVFAGSENTLSIRYLDTNWEEESRRDVDVARDQVAHAALSQDGKRVFFINKDGAALIWDVESGKSIADFKISGIPTTRLAPNPDGSRFLSVSDDNVASIWGVEQKKKISAFLIPVEKVRFPNFGPDGARVLSWEDTTVRVWNVGGQGPVSFESFEKAISSPDFNPDGKGAAKATDHWYFLIESPDGARLLSTRSWDWTDMAKGRDYDGAHWQPPVDNKVYAFAYSPDGTYVLTWNMSSPGSGWNRESPTLWNSKTGTKIAVLKQPDVSNPDRKGIKFAAFSPDGAHLVTATSWGFENIHRQDGDNETKIIEGHRLWDAETGKQLPATPLSFLAASPDGMRVITSDWGRRGAVDTVQLWDAKTGNRLFNLKVGNAMITSAAFSPDGTRIATAGGDHTNTFLFPRVWDAKTGELIFSLEHHTQVSVKTAFSPDGTRILTTSKDRTVRLWDAETGRHTAILEIPGNSWEMNDAVFSPDSTLVFVITRLGDGVVWDAASGLIVDLFKGWGYLKSAAFSPDGRRVAVEMGQFGEHGAQVWDLRPPARDDPECLRLSIEFRTGLAWNDKTKSPNVLSAEKISERRKLLDKNYKGKFCDAREWDDLSEGERAALRGPERK